MVFTRNTIRFEINLCLQEPYQKLQAKTTNEQNLIKYNASITELQDKSVVQDRGYKQIEKNIGA